LSPPGEDEDLVTQTVELPGGELRLLQPAEAAELPDAGGIEWAPLVDYWSVLWRSGVALARELAAEDLRGRRVVELGCGLGVPSLAAARAGAEVLATDGYPEPLELLARNAAANGVEVETAIADWYRPGDLPERGPFDLLLAADVLYIDQAADALLELLPGLARGAMIADPGRSGARELVRKAARDWDVESTQRGVVEIHRLSPRGA
jgi:predicted nicotinamide N-methyase